MIVSVSQPYFAPFPGFFEKAFRCDLLVILDRVQFPRGTTWISRNRFKNDRGTLWMTVPVWKKGLGLQQISQVRICHETPWAEKGVRSLRQAYANAPWFEEHLPVLERIFFRKEEKLIDLDMEIIRYLMDVLKIDTRVRLLSDLGVKGRGNRLLVDTAQAVGADRFLAQGAAAKHLVSEEFRKRGIALEFFTPRHIVYPQLWGDFIGNLSTFDLLFNCGPGARRILLGR